MLRGEKQKERGEEKEKKNKVHLPFCAFLSRKILLLSPSCSPFFLPLLFCLTHLHFVLFSPFLPSVHFYLSLPPSLLTTPYPLCLRIHPHGPFTYFFFFILFFLPRRSRLSNNVSFFFFFFSRAPLPTPPPPQLPLRAVLREPRLSRRDQALKPAPGPDGGRGKEVLGPPQPPERGVRQRGALRAVGRAVRWGHGAGDGGRRGG